MRIEDLEEDFNLHKKYSNGLRRLKKKRIPYHGGKAGVLPPLGGASDVHSKG